MTDQPTTTVLIRPSVDELASGAADQWGSREDPCRLDFIRGYKDQRDGKRDAPEEMAAGAAYNSGYIASRDDQEAENRFAKS
ncbi:hypothetical protein [Erythrobacter aureus]|uniref:Uncharacterized protein n=1 Tax=Erythrobacter aureus TaxID=2182384 RepID=A0A345YJ17_9SPHN|nr:hypothetical protein [Erythrobacter aureus]AXK43919.1 hypothetical protein DVR09_15810 [Erythrobacter aureus]